MDPYLERGRQKQKLVVDGNAAGDEHDTDSKKKSTEKRKLSRVGGGGSPAERGDRAEREYSQSQQMPDHFAKDQLSQRGAVVEAIVRQLMPPAHPPSR